MTILEMLRRGKDFTAAEVSLAEYILANAQLVPGASITELAERSYTSNATVVRLSRKLGFTGYRELRVRLAAELATTQSFHRELDSASSFGAEQDVADVMEGIAGLTFDAISACRELVAPEIISRAAGMLREVRDVYLYAYGDSYVSCEVFANQLLKLGTRCVMAGRYHEEVQNAHSVTRDDVVMLVTYSGYFIEQERACMQILRERNARLIVVTARPDLAEPLGAEVVIPMPSGDSRGKGIGPVFSQTCIRYVLNCLYGAVSSFDFEKGEIWRVATES